MDISALFKACVKTVRLRNKALGIPSDTKSPLKKTTKQTPFFGKARDVLMQITKLRDFLLENRKAYLNFANHLTSLPQMSEAERDQIDLGAQKIMTTCSHLIKDLERELAGFDGARQDLEHREIVLLLIEKYLRNVCKVYSEQKAIRVKRAMEMRKMARLESNTSKLKLSKSSLSVPEVQEERDQLSSNESSPMKIQEINGDVNLLADDEELTAEDIQILESENAQLHNELNTLTEEVKQVESKVVHIAELQEIFTEKVLDQDRNLDRLMTTVVGSTENVKEANEQIRQAIQRNAGLRVWILFFLIVMSFSLLFLDWYND
ncbi:syntaxin-18 [Neodiprion lecontei]|uniref:Syntaxin-18 n=1 Tax=Neodiprion lecontei TaxID=441921 RepID=A0A6J0BHL9_NEOLC|nr:syntaxin-18 [Neodiprion lecontei]